MIDLWFVLLLVLFISTLSAIVTYNITKGRYYLKGKKDGLIVYQSDLYRDTNVEKMILERLQKYKESDEYKATLANCTLNGEKEGAKNELAKFKIVYTPFINTKDEFLKKKAEIGYLMQLFYGGLPIGEPTKKITQIEEKFKEENAKELLATVKQCIEAMSSLAVCNNIPNKIAPILRNSKRNFIDENENTLSAQQ